MDARLFLLLLLQEVADFGEEHFFLCWLWCWSGGSLLGFLLLAEGRCLGDGLHDEEEAEGVFSLSLIWKEVNGMIDFHEQEMQQIKLLDYEEDHYCLVYKKDIDCDLS